MHYVIQFYSMATGRERYCVDAMTQEPKKFSNLDAARKYAGLSAFGAPTFIKKEGK